MDPAALGTTIIGLEAVRAEQDLDAQPRPRRPRKARVEGLRLALATALRRLADLAEPRRRSAPGRA